jgi:hypothetical protein
VVDPSAISGSLTQRDIHSMVELLGGRHPHFGEGVALLRTAAWIFAVVLTIALAIVFATEVWHGRLLVPALPYRLLVGSWSASLVAALVMMRADHQRQIAALERRLRRQEEKRLDRIAALLEPEQAPVIPLRRHLRSH